jgi:hypothetical protein
MAIKERSSGLAISRHWATYKNSCYSAHCAAIGPVLSVKYLRYTYLQVVLPM